MTEKEWLESAEIRSKLKFLLGKATDRKLRLYLCAGSRHISHLFFRPWSLAAVEVAERFADGEATQEELRQAQHDAEAATFGYEFDNSLPWNDPYRSEIVPILVEIGALPTSALFGGEWQIDEPTRQKLTPPNSLIVVHQLMCRHGNSGGSVAFRGWIGPAAGCPIAFLAIHFVPLLSTRLGLSLW
jgi:hypothetical protein